MEKEKLEKASKNIQTEKEGLEKMSENISKDIEDSKKTNKKEANKKRLVFLLISAMVLILIGLLVFKFAPINLKTSKTKTLKPEVAKVTAEDFINNNLMLPGTKATITEITPEYGLYKIIVSVESGELIESYISQDGLLFFPQAIAIDEQEAELNKPLKTSEVSNKQDKINIELFVMSHCNYGTQMEKALLPVIEALGSKANFELKFNSYVMNDKLELDEQLTQYCIQKENNDKLISYLNCFNKAGESDTCLSENNINKTKILACVKITDNEYKISENYADQSTWLSGAYPSFPIYEEDNNRYGVQGSPTLIINGEMVSAERNSQSLLKLACSGFINEPSECQTQLSEVEPGYGFGE